MPENKILVVLKDDEKGMELLSKKVVACLEIISSFSEDGKYIPSQTPKGRMEFSEVSKLYNALYGKLHKLSFKNPKKLQRMNPKKIIKIIRPAHEFILGIYRNGTPGYRFKSMRVDESIPDEFILDRFAIEFKESLLQGPENYIEGIKE